jgi:hypothetical protein
MISPVPGLKTRLPQSLAQTWSEDEDFEGVGRVIGFSEEEFSSCSGIQIWSMKMTKGKVSPQLTLLNCSIHRFDAKRCTTEEKPLSKGSGGEDFLWRSSSSMNMVEWGRWEIL